MWCRFYNLYIFYISCSGSTSTPSISPSPSPPSSTSPSPSPSSFTSPSPSPPSSISPSPSPSSSTSPSPTPPSCSGTWTASSYKLSWEVSDDGLSVEFNVSVTTASNTWVAVGFSATHSMVRSCTWNCHYYNYVVLYKAIKIILKAWILNDLFFY